MVPDIDPDSNPDPDAPSLSRRRLLGGLAAGTGLAGGTVAVGATRPTALPNVLADWATNVYPTPPARSSLWQPTVTEDHAREAVSMLAETEEEATTLWDGIDDDAHLTGAGGWLETAEEDLENGDYEDALFDARYGMQFAAEELGEARARLEEADLEAFAERSVAVFDRVDAVVDDIDPYPVRKPARNLAWYVEIELEAQRARHLADWYGLEDVRDEEAEPDVSATDPRDVGEITSQLRRAEIDVETAERYADRLLEDVAGADRTYRSHLQDVVEEFRTELESIPTRDEVRSRYIDDVESYGPYEFAHSRLARWCFPASITPPWERSIDDDFLVVRVLGTARGLVDWRAHEYAVDEHRGGTGRRDVRPRTRLRRKAPREIDLRTARRFESDAVSGRPLGAGNRERPRRRYPSGVLERRRSLDAVARARPGLPPRPRRPREATGVSGRVRSDRRRRMRRTRRRRDADRSSACTSIDEP